MTNTDLDIDAERASFEVWARNECCMPPNAPLKWGADWTKAAWDGYLAARRATIQPTADFERAPSTDSINESVEFQGALVDLLVCVKNGGHISVQTEKVEALTDIIDARPAPVAPADAVRDAERDMVLERAAEMLDTYEKHLYALTPINIEEHPYLPSIGEAAAELRAMKSTPKEPAK